MNSRRNCDNNIGYIGNTSYNLKYITRSRDFRCTWPHNNLFATAKDEDSLLQNLLMQKVGRRNQINDNENLKNLKNILKCFLQHHRKTNYKLVLKKCVVKVSTKTQQHMLGAFRFGITVSLIPAQTRFKFEFHFFFFRKI